jgi:dTDP-4-dehydrorhamnose reductase
MRLLITGGSGYLGARLTARAAGDVWAAYFSRPVSPAGVAALPLDLRDAARVRAVVADLRPDAILHTACSNRTAADVAAIVPAARHLAEAARATGARLIHVSTDLVFDGEHPPYADDAPPAPQTEYGRAKAEAEAVVAAIIPAALVVRPSLIWGFNPLDKQTTWLVDGMRNGETVTLFTDEFRCPVWVDDLADALLELAARPDISGVMNLAGPQALNRWDFGLKLLAALGLEPGPHVVRGTARALSLIRPRNLTLTSARAVHLLRTPLHSVDAALRIASPARDPGHPLHQPYCEC